ncbi:MAG: Ni/Fe hydrogenase subunit alpha [Planctomycetes bacterium]|nr:Ni/Fe hydrogenase subunit alpha [Planctomycetota bacterium]
MKNVTIDVKHVTRVEGHGNIAVRVRDGEITNLQLQIVESPRYFEAMLRGRHYSEAPHITCRICGICAVGHTTASVNGMEAALGITPTEQTVLLRKLVLNGEEMQSHVLHVMFLAVPDFLGVGSVIPLAKTHPEVVKIALRLKRLSNDLCAVVGGRHIHPIAHHVGGLTHTPRDEELLDLKRRLEAAREDLKIVAETYSTFAIPQLERDTEYVALTDVNKKEYAFYNGAIVSTKDPQPTAVPDYRKRCIEQVVQHSTGKHCHSPNAPSFAVGALARFNNNHEQLHPAAKDVAHALGLKAVCMNPFHNNTAQIVEVVHCVEHSIELIDELLTRGLQVEPLQQPTKYSQSAGAAEVPRGLLYHEYSVNSKGIIDGANLIIPTTQNLKNIEEDMRAYVPQLLESDMSKEEMTLQLEMLVRAYDPCISCSVHFLDVDWM